MATTILKSTVSVGRVWRNYGERWPGSPSVTNPCFKLRLQLCPQLSRFIFVTRPLSSVSSHFVFNFVFNRDEDFSAQRCQFEKWEGAATKVRRQRCGDKGAAT